MSSGKVTRAHLTSVLSSTLGLSHRECAVLLEDIISNIYNCLVMGDDVKLPTFGVFRVREKSLRIGRNPKTGESFPVTARKVLVFKPSQVLLDKINSQILNKTTEE